MKVTNWCKKLSATLVAAGLLAPAASYAASIPLGDSDFEAYAVPARGYAYAAGNNGTYRPTSAWVDDLDGPDGSVQDDASSNWLYTATYAEKVTYTRRAAPRSGIQAMHGLGRYSAQETNAVFEAGRTYTFSLWAQNDVDLNEANGVFMYIFDGTVPFNDANSLSKALFTTEIPARGAAMTAAESQASWAQLSISHVVAPGAPEIGHPVGVGFYARKDSAVDDASLTSLVPEPATILVGVGGLVAVSLMRRRRE